MWHLWSHVLQRALSSTWGTCVEQVHVQVGSETVKIEMGTCGTCVSRCHVERLIARVAHVWHLWPHVLRRALSSTWGTCVARCYGEHLHLGEHLCQLCEHLCHLCQQLASWMRRIYCNLPESDRALVRPSACTRGTWPTHVNSEYVCEAERHPPPSEGQAALLPLIKYTWSNPHRGLQSVVGATVAPTNVCRLQLQTHPQRRQRCRSLLLPRSCCCPTSRPRTPSTCT